MKEIRRILKRMNSELLYKIYKIARLDDTEHKLMQAYYVRKQSRDFICELLSISRSTFTRLKNQAELKIKIAMTSMCNEKLTQMGEKVNY